MALVRLGGEPALVERVRALLPPYARDRPAETPGQRERLEGSAALVALSARAVGAAPRPEAWGRTDAGAPVPPPGLPCASLSHTRALAAIALARVPVGVDVERARVGRDLEMVARAAFAPEERAWWERLPAPAREAAFLRAWTLKEAVLKAAGLGLAGGLEAVVTDARGELVAVPPALGGEVGGWSVTPLDTRDTETAAALALWHGGARGARGGGGAGTGGGAASGGGAVRVVHMTIAEALR